VSEISVRALRNHGGDVIDRVLLGENLMDTRDGKPVAQLVPLGKPPLSADMLLQRWRNLPPVDPKGFRRDIDAFVDPSL
jgi:antitoxin (DNA-binding transcriptional repressor) of toxin-antitoxin stability system